MLTSKSQKKIRNFTGLLGHRRLHAPEDLPQGLLLHLRGHPLQGRPRALEGEPQDPRVPPAPFRRWRRQGQQAQGVRDLRELLRAFLFSASFLNSLCVFILVVRERERDRGDFVKRKSPFSFGASARFSSTPLFSFGKKKGSVHLSLSRFKRHEASFWLLLIFTRSLEYLGNRGEAQSLSRDRCQQTQRRSLLLPLLPRAAPRAPSRSRGSPPPLLPPSTRRA